jgi:hypothetical protein
MAERLGDSQQDQEKCQDLQPTVESHGNSSEALRTEQGVDQVDADSDGNGSAQKVIEQHGDLLEGSEPRAGARVGRSQREEGQGGEKENGVAHGVSLLGEGYASPVPGLGAGLPAQRSRWRNRSVHSATNLCPRVALCTEEDRRFRGNRPVISVFGARKWLSDCTK